MDYYKWKRRMKIRAFILLLSACASGLLLLHELTVYARYNMPVEIIYPLSEIPEDQAVIEIYVFDYVAFNDDNYYACCIVANKEGRWKIYTGRYYEEFEKKYGKGHLENEYKDYILENDMIPWQPGKIDIDSKVLEQALNMRKVKFISPNRGGSDGVGIYWDLISPAEEREDINYFAEPFVNHRHIVSYMQGKFQELEEAGRQILPYGYLYHVNEIR